MFRHLLPLAALALVACGPPVTPEPPSPEPSSVECTPDGYVIPDPQPGDAFLACADERVQSTVTTGGEVRSYWDGGCLTLTIETVEPGARAIVVQLRGPGGAAMCAEAFERVSE